MTTDCKNLDKEGLCKIHKNRPKTCYEHSHETCVFHNKETGEMCKLRIDMWDWYNGNRHKYVEKDVEVSK